MHRDTITTTTLVNLTSTHTIITTTKCLQHVQPRIYKVYPEVYKELKWQCIAMFSGVLPTSIVSYMHALALASLKTWNPKESAGRETVSLASCSTGSSSGREVLSTSCSRWPFRVTCLGKIETEREIERERRVALKTQFCLAAFLRLMKVIKISKSVLSLSRRIVGPHSFILD